MAVAETTTFDFNDSNVLSAQKEMVLMLQKMQPLLDDIGEVRLTPQVCSYLFGGHGDDSSDFAEILDLSDLNIDFFKKTAVVDAYFHSMIHEQLSSLDAIEVCIPRHEREKIRKPQTSEPDVLSNSWYFNPRRAIFQQGDGLGSYRAPTPPNALTNKDLGDFGEKLGSMEDVKERTSALQMMYKRVNQEGALSQVSSTCIMDLALLFHDNELQEEYESLSFGEEFNRANEYRKAGVDRVGDLGAYNLIELLGDSYSGLDLKDQVIVHEYVTKNMADARNIKLAEGMFPEGVPSSLELNAKIRGLLSGNIAIENGKFNNDLTEDLHEIAKGAESLIDSYDKQDGQVSSKSAEELAEYAEDLAGSRTRETAPNILSFFGGVRQSESWKPTPLTATTLSDMVRLYDGESAQNVHDAWGNLYGNEVIVKGEDWTIGYALRLTEEGTVEARAVDTSHGVYPFDYDDPEVKKMIRPFDFIMYARENSDFRQYSFEDNMRKIVDDIRGEMDRNVRVAENAKDFLNTPVEVDSNILAMMKKNGHLYGSIEKMNRQVAVIHDAMKGNSKNPLNSHAGRITNYLSV